MYGTMPTTAMTVTSAARPVLLPKRAPMRSAIEVMRFARLTRSTLRMSTEPRQKASVGPR